MKCPSCHAGELIYDTTDWRRAYKTDEPAPPDASGYFCPACEMSVLYGHAAQDLPRIGNEPDEHG